MKFGLCTSPSALGFPDEQKFLNNVAKLKEAGAKYLEFPVAAVSPENDRDAFEPLRAVMERSPLKSDAFNCFIPGHIRITGEDVSLSRLISYCQTALPRCKTLGAEVVVLGSGGARRISEGFDHQRALDQFREFCTALGPVAADSEIVIAIEPLNKTEDNLITSVDAGAAIVDAVGHPNIQLLADFYHMMRDSEDLAAIDRAGSRLRHTHLADTGRVVPGKAEVQADFVGFFRHLKSVGYSGSDARCSFEGSSEDLLNDAAPMLELLTKRAKQ